MSNYAAVCVAPDGSTVTTSSTGQHPYEPIGSACVATMVEVIQAFDGTDGSTGGIGVIPCGGASQPACQNGAASGTTACGLPGMPSCTTTSSSTSSSGSAQSMDFTVDGFDVLVAVAMVVCFGVGWVAGGQR